MAAKQSPPIPLLTCSYCKDTAEIVTVLKVISLKVLVENAEGRQFTILTDLIGPIKQGDQVWADAGVGLAIIR